MTIRQLGTTLDKKKRTIWEIDQAKTLFWPFDIAWAGLTRAQAMSRTCSDARREQPVAPRCRACGSCGFKFECEEQCLPLFFRKSLTTSAAVEHFAGRTQEGRRAMISDLLLAGVQPGAIMSLRGAVSNYRHFVSNERCSFELNPPPPPPPNEHIHYMRMEKCWPRNAGIVYMMRHTCWCLALRSISGKAWCLWLYRRAFRVLLFERGWSRPSDIRSAHHWLR